MDMDMWNGQNVHFPIVWVDGVRWLLRVRHLHPDNPSVEFRQAVIISEAETMNALNAINGDQIPSAWLPLTPTSLGSKNPGGLFLNI